MAFSVVPIDSQVRWENFLRITCPSAFFQSWLWGEVDRALGAKVWRLGFWQQNKLVGLAQIVKVAARRGPFLHLRHGPVFSNPNRRIWEGALDYLKDLARKERCWFIRVSPLVVDANKTRQLFQTLGMRPSPIHAMDAERCWVLDLGKSEEELLANMRKTTRYEIKRAQKLKVNVVASWQAKELGVFLKLYQQTSLRQGFVPHQGIAQEFAIFSQEHRALLFLGSYQGRILAGAIIIFYQNQAIYHHGASLATSIPASYLIQWEAIKEAKKRGYKLYNFWGIAPENNPKHPWQGITLFKRGFGGRPVEYLHAHDWPLSAWYIIPQTIESVRRVLKGY